MTFVTGAVSAPCEAALLHAGRGRYQGRPQGLQGQEGEGSLQLSQEPITLLF